MANEVEIVVKTTDRSGPGMTAAGRGTDGLRDRLGRLNRAAVVASAGVVAGFVSMGMGAAQAASNQAEALNKSNTVFGSNGAAIRRWAEGASTDFGQSTTDALNAASSFGNMFTQLGIGADRASDMSTSMTELASDFASFHNADITEVVQAQEAAFRGEYDALQRFVPTISAATVEQKALAQTGKESADSLTAGEKAAATYALMMEGAGQATGDFDRTADGAANKQRIMNAEWENAQASLGEALLPAMTEVVGLLAQFAQWASENQGTVMALAAVIGGLAATVLLVNAAVAVWSAVSTIAAAATWLWNAALLANPITWIVLGIIALIAIIVLLVIHFDTVKAAAAAAWDWIKEKAAQAFHWIAANWPLLLAILTGPIGIAVLLITRNWQTIKDGFNAVKEWIGARVGDIVSFLTGIPGRIAGAASRLGSLIKDGVTSAANWVREKAGAIVDFIRSIPGRIGNIGSQIKDRILGGLSGVAGSVLSAVNPFAHGGIVGAASGKVAGGLTMVGEHGRELVDLPAGSRVHGNSATEGMLSRGGGGGTTVNMYVQGSILSERDVSRIVRDVLINGGFGGSLA